MRVWLVFAVCLTLIGCAGSRTAIKQDVQPKTKAVKTEVKRAPVITKPFEVLLSPPVPGGTPSYPFGTRKGEFHRGLDIAAPMGTPVLACMEGEVTYAGRYKFVWGYGNAVMIKHTTGVYTFYAHLQALAVKKGTKVDEGQRIGSIGNTGRSRGPHLHLELIIKEKHHNPALYFKRHLSFSAQLTEWYYKFKKTLPTPGWFGRLTGYDD